MLRCQVAKVAKSRGLVRRFASEAKEEVAKAAPAPTPAPVVVKKGGSSFMQRRLRALRADGGRGAVDEADPGVRGGAQGRDDRAERGSDQADRGA